MPFSLLADIGGTNARFWSVDSATEEIIHQEKLKVADYQSFDDLLSNYNENSQIVHQNAIFALACPIINDEINFIKNNWHFKCSEIQKKFAFKDINFVNDFLAEALAIPYLKNEDIINIGNAPDNKNEQTKAVIGIGTGLGAGFLQKINRIWKGFATEGGNAKLPATSHKESEIIKILTNNYSQEVTYESVISGSGLENIYSALSIMYNLEDTFLPADKITDKALKNDDLALNSVNTMFEFFGNFAGNYALSTAALGGVYISGGILKKEGIKNLFLKSNFREKFINNNTFKNYLDKIPTLLITTEDTALLGLKNLLRNEKKSTCNLLSEMLDNHSR